MTPIADLGSKPSPGTAADPAACVLKQAGGAPTVPGDGRPRSVVGSVDVAYSILWTGVWWAAVLGAVHGYPWLGPVLALVPLALAAWVRPQRTALLVVAAVLVGLLVDATLSLSGLTLYRGSLMSPPWMWALWALLGAALPGCLAPVARRPWAALLFGALGGPLAYLGGAQLGAMTLPAGMLPAALGIGVAYGLAVPLLARIAVLSDPATPRPRDPATVPS